MLAIIKEAREMAAEDSARPLRSCPLCGNPLTVNARNGAICDVGHYSTQDVANGGT